MSLYTFAPEDARRFASEQGIPWKIKGNELLLRRCPYCGKDEGFFAINLTTGAFNCKRASCGAKGNMLTLHRDFGFDLGTDVREYEKPRFAWRRFKKPDAPFEPTPEAIAYLCGKRRIAEDVVRRYEVTTHRDDSRRLVFPFFDEAGELVFVKYRLTDFDRTRDKNKEWCERDTRAILFGMRQCEDFTRLVLTEGQLDSLSVATAGIKNACSVPNGKNGMTWIPHCWEWLTRFQEVTVFGDFERGEMTLLADIQRRLSCRVNAVREADYRGCKDANELLQKHGPEAVRKAVERAEPILPEQVIRLCDVPEDDATREERLKTGIAPLDRLLHGGMSFGFLDILTGKRGDGKSTFGSMIVKSALEQGHSVFVYSGEMRCGDVRLWLERQLAGPERVIQTPREGYTLYSLSRPNCERMRAWYRDRAFIYDTSRLVESARPLPDIVQTVIRQYGCRVVLIDNLMTAIDISGAGGTKFEQQETVCKQLARIAQEYNALILLVAHKKKTAPKYQADENDDVLGSSEITNLAGIVMSYEREKAGGENERRLKVTKNRLTGRLNFDGIPLFFDEASKRVTSAEESPNAASPAFTLENGFEEFTMDDMDIPF